MSAKGKPWKPQRAPSTYRRSRDMVMNAYRDLSTVHIPTSTSDTRDGRRQCYRKKAYSEAMAKDAAFRSPERGVTLVAYPCPHCGRWHIGR
jgi:predicted RNA-binding Zn-ribbon protein involved in translation (DUF1610 family)